MGILKLMDFIRDRFARAVTSKNALDYYGKILAIDASNTMYQFLIKTQTITRNDLNTPTDSFGNKTGHLLGLLSRSLFCIENKILPIWVFDGRPPSYKYKELSKRKQKKYKAKDLSIEAYLHGDLIEALKQQQRTVSISLSEKEDAMRMIKLMGMPIVEAPSEAYAQCAYLCKMGYAYGVVSEDMDTLTHGARYLIRNFNKKDSIQQIDLYELLLESGLTMEQFIDFCILCGCDYTGRISNIGPVRAYGFIKKHQNIEEFLNWLSTSEYRSRYRPEANFSQATARSLFKNPNIKTEGFDFRWNPINQIGLKEFLTEKDFSEMRVNNWLKKATDRSN